MTNPINLTSVEKELRRTFNKDGLTYIFMGLLLATVGLSLYDSRFTAFGGLAALLIFPAEWVRRRITYPRLGYVQFKLPDGTARGIITFTIIAIAILTLFAFVSDGRFARYLPLVIGFTMTLAFYFGALMKGITMRDWLLMLLMASTGIIAIFLFEDWHRATALQMWLMALLLISSGAFDLFKFIQEYPIMEKAES